MAVTGTKVRVRFAPSPTGHLHIGGLRTALFNWLFARHHGGTYLLRIEDTDTERSHVQYVDSILDALAWVSLISDEPHVFQSQRKDVYQKFLTTLFEKGRAYYCRCTQQELEQRCAKVVVDGKPIIKYDSACRTKNIQSGGEEHTVIRFALPQDKTELTFRDVVRGSISLSLTELDDFIIARSDGEILYNGAVVADDIAMAISHVIRGEDHIANTFKQILLYEAVEAPIPLFGHLPLILNKDGGPLSKRDAATSVLDYRVTGYLPDALLNYLVRLGWSHEDQEIFSRDELIKLFSLEHVGKKGAAFDPEKLLWVNGMYIREMQCEDLLRYLQNVMFPITNTVITWDDQSVIKVIALYKDRVTTMRELLDVVVASYAGPKALDRHVVHGLLSREVQSCLEELSGILEGLSTAFSLEEVTMAMTSLLEEHKLVLPKVAKPLRYALIGDVGGPGIFALLSAVGKQESIRRIGQLLAAAS